MAPLDIQGTLGAAEKMRDRRGYPYKRSHLVALRVGKITASDPPSVWWPGER
jgi:hypothetical protein